MGEEPRKCDLEDRLVKFAIIVLGVCDLLPNTRAANNLEYQLSKSGTAPALMYGEVQAAESRADFIHKMKILLKELRETRISLRIINEKPVIKDAVVEAALKECNELIGIFTKSVETAKKNRVG
ncbi:MAG: four helix bundle protein [Chitinophagaceae bacterium]|nr:four helix bundle protein [Chitinophagaceae bacterium]